MVYIIKKDGTKEEFDASKIKRAVNKSAGRVMYRFTDDEINFYLNAIRKKIGDKGKILVAIDACHSGGTTTTGTTRLGTIN